MSLNYLNQFKEGTSLAILAIALFLVLVFLAVAPFVLLWCINTLIPVLAIPYTFWTWLAVVGIHVYAKFKFSLVFSK